MASKPKQTFLKCWSLVAALALPALSAPTLAEEFLCDATQASTNELPLLDKSCPIGKGLWGKSQPRGQESTFWIQCGVFSQPLPLPKAKRLYQHISTDVWAKPEANAYRCLIGPYKDFAQASTELAKVKTEPGYKEAFVREVVKGAPLKQVKAKPAPKSSTPKPVVKPQQSTTVIPAPVKAKPEPIKPMAQEPKQRQSDVSIRLTATVSGIEYKVPYTMFSNDQFYMEHELPWNRLDYEGAYKTCYRLGMRLATPTEWQALLASKVMQKDKWPMHLPYWGAEKSGLFTSGKTNKLKGTSLLNVMCVK
ncbi:SPOR domain-containing protein [Vibrio europaeus]|uniref:SPOR domain-containing protein n=1 Tax=Vibrio europaeus TaxID=300876 RepID=A0AAE7DXI3_9VIBR|nr:SPOR domain-containing protein [Vibrio europaeus]MDC5804332.1 SPOR domain-containing protein [Vibrio europaeus]MDC5808409.1 SPOR domain-containing protein [Vibrio europaeus]MDC5821016.1 SPOR domain-containing protein [Vibrio europaeus]MDC5824366.1 SPOR domain-containing protein [Vibrio europaeus]MDC5829774.1 SPOR domain-containing protein [Vibrio europaeus]